MFSVPVVNFLRHFAQYTDPIVALFCAIHEAEYKKFNHRGTENTENIHYFYCSPPLQKNKKQSEASNHYPEILSYTSKKIALKSAK